MSEFPNNFDFVIYGTGIVESVLSAALSTTGHHVLHLDRNDYYGGYSGCFRISELEKSLDKWKNPEVSNNNNNMFTETEENIKFAYYKWNVNADSCELESNGNDCPSSSSHIWTERLLRQNLRGFEFEILPRILFSESQTIDALIQSDVTRYLEFKFISKFATLSDNKIIPIPINRSDIVKTKVFSLRQKRQLTSFLEWCYTVNFDDEIVSKYANRPLFELMSSEKHIDNFTGKIIIECMALSSQTVETKEGIAKIKRLLNSFNKFGPYPIMWPNYGCGEISQAFCRMSAVFGTVYSLNTLILSCNYQPTQNGEYETSQENQIPIDHRKLKLTLSNGNDVFTDKIISHKSYLKSEYLANIDQMKWISRAIFITNKSLIHESREQNDILMFPFHLDNIEKPVILLEFPVEGFRNEHTRDLFAVHLTIFTETIFDPKELLQDYVGRIFDNYSVSTESIKPQILFECYFSLPDFSNVSLNLQSFNNISNNLVFVNSQSSNIEFDECLKEANDIFLLLSPGVEFLPRPPNPEDIILLENEVISSTNQISGDFPFETNIQSNNDIINAPGDSSTANIIISGEISHENVEELLAEIELNVTNSDINTQSQ